MTEMERTMVMGDDTVTGPLADTVTGLQGFQTADKTLLKFIPSDLGTWEMHSGSVSVEAVAANTRPSYVFTALVISPSTLESSSHEWVRELPTIDCSFTPGMTTLLAPRDVKPTIYCVF